MLAGGVKKRDFPCGTPLFISGRLAITNYDLDETPISTVLSAKSL
jgi:hypothetical protein